ncbi:PTPDL family protein [Sulfuriroseicoccus oceanibius]|uniref:Uncharacterized protein n=1 Tax=Sulfuriroseicoccus oceanibius TaxID=2707525 RepID=A0A6B3L788_9BACT|nr:PTPDL family protein [Sulfuriroseicoccus oceanibius]QQL43992.1 hypothetical protein G3M56_008800 [Sulfuriroseicoccus oceanibius]
MTRNIFKKQIPLAASAVILMLGSAWADTVILNDGTKYEGNVLSETDEKVVIQVRVGGILDEKHIPASEVQGVVMQTPEQKMWEKSKVTLPTPDLRGVAYYDELIDEKLKPFIAEFPTGVHIREAKLQLETLEGEKEKVQQGGVKIDGLWLSPEEYEQRKYWIDAEKELLEMRNHADEGNIVSALRTFDALENEYPESGAFAQALTEVRPVLERYDRELRAEIDRGLTLDDRVRAATGSLSGAEKRVTEATIRRKAELAEKRTEREKKQDVKWLTPNEYDNRMLGDIRKTVKSELERVIELNPAVIEERAELLQRIEKTLYEGRLDTAASLMERHEAKLDDSEYLEELAKLEERLRNEQASREEAEVVMEVDKESIAKAASEAVEAEKDAEEAAAAEAEEEVQEVSGWGDADAPKEGEEGGFSMVTVGIVVLLLVLAGAVFANIKKKNED